MSDNFLFYSSWLDIIEQNYPDNIAMQNQLIHNIVLYGIRGVRDESVEKMFIQQAYVQIDSAKQKHEKRVEAGRKGGSISKGGGAPKGNQNAKSKTTSKQQANDNVNVKDKVNENTLSLTSDDVKEGVGTRLEAVPPPKGYKWSNNRIDECGDGKHYRVAQNLETGEKVLRRID